MLKHIWSILCRRSVVDQSTNTMSLYDAIEQITLQGTEMPRDKIALVPFDCEVVTLWMRPNLKQPTKGDTRMQIFNETNEILATLDFRVDLTKLHRIRVQARMRAFPLKGVGLYTIQVQVRNVKKRSWNTVASLPIEVNFTFVPEPTKATTSS